MRGLLELKKELRKAANPQKAKLLQRFFKTGIGEYGEGDIFLGITVPQLRKTAKKYYSLDIKQLKELIASKIHEERLIALFILINKYKTTNHKKICFHFYIKNMKYINNWDLVDLSAPKIVGQHLLDYHNFARQPRVSEPSGDIRTIRGPVKSNPSRQGSHSLHAVGSPSSFATPFLLISLAKSENVWERRISVLATFQFIKNNQFDDSLKIAEILLNDKHDLIHKAVGWMLREIGKRDLRTEEEFLRRYYKKMPRTMLRYAIERFPKTLKKSYLSGKA